MRLIPNEISINEDYDKFAQQRSKNKELTRYRAESK